MRPAIVSLCVLALCLLAGPVSAAEDGALSAHCHQRVSALRPQDPARCLRQAGDAGMARTKAIDALFDRADDEATAGRFDQAAGALACAEALAGNDAGLHYQLMRRHGILEFRQDHIPQALDRFECATQLAVERGDAVAQVRDLKNVGAALRRLGDYRGALAALTRSIDIQRTHAGISGEVTGALYNNLGDVYRDLGDPASATRYYQQAVAAFRADGDETDAGHVLEAMAELALDSGDAHQADVWLHEALAIFRDEKNRVMELRVHDGLTRVALALGNSAQAREWAASAQALAEANHIPIPAALQLQIARTERLSGHADASMARVQKALADMSADDPDRVKLLDELASAQSATGQLQAANDTLRRVNTEAAAVSRTQHDLQLDWVRTRFDTFERDRRIAALEQKNRIRTLQVWGVLVSMLAVLLVGWLLLERRRQRQKLQAEADRIRLESELAGYRREADALAEDRELLRILLNSREDAACLLDAEGQVLAANSAAGRLLGVSADSLVGAPLAGVLAAADGQRFDGMLERMEDSAAQTMTVATAGGTALSIHATPWAGGGGRVVLGLSPDDGRQAAPSVDAPAATDRRPADAAHGVDTPSTVATPVEPFDESTAESSAMGDAAADSGADVMREGFRGALVALMLAAIEAWESATASNRIELAEKSRIWRVNIDDGRLRARAMERYLNVAKLPQNPRWRDVLRTAYYVLGQCPGLGEPGRARLQQHVDAVLAYTRRDTMV